MNANSPDRNPTDQPLINEQLFGTVLNERRQALGMTIPEVARLASVSMSTVHKLENGSITVQLDIVLKVLQALKMDPVAFFEQVMSGRADVVSSFSVELAQNAKKDISQLLRDIADSLDQNLKG